jgi:hypothetical protein
MSEMSNDWSAPLKPDSGVTSFEDHCLCETPLGRAIIEWKSWKDYPAYTLLIADEFGGAFDSLEQAKAGCADHIRKVAAACDEWLSQQRFATFTAAS